MFFEKYECDIASYADDNTPHTYDSELYTVLSKLKNCTDNLLTWFNENHMIPNDDKCHLFVTTEKSDGSNVNYMDLPKRRVLMKAFIASQIRFCPLIRMLHSRTLNKLINNIHERGLRLTYKDNQFSSKQLLEKDHSVTVHHKNLQVLVTEIFKVKNNLAPRS